MTGNGGDTAPVCFAVQRDWNSRTPSTRDISLPRLVSKTASKGRTWVKKVCSLRYADCIEML